MNIDRLSLEGMAAAVETELRLRPGLNLLVAPNEGMRRQLAEAVRAALAEPRKGEPHEAPLPEHAVDDAQVLSAEQLALFNRMAKVVGVSRAALAAGLLGGWRLPVIMDRLRQQADVLGTSRGPGPELATTLEELGQVQRESKAIAERLAQAPRLNTKLKALDAKLKEAERREAEQAQGVAHALKLEAALGALNKLETVEAERSRRAKLADFPEDGVKRLQAIQAELKDARALREPILRTSAEVQKEIDALSVPYADLLEAELRTLLDLYRERADSLKALPERQAAFDEQRKRIEAGAAPPKEGATRKTTTRAVKIADMVLEAKGFLSQREASWRTARRVRERIESEVRRLTLEVAKLPAAPVPVVRGRLGALQRLKSLREERERTVAERQRRETRLGEVNAELARLFVPDHPFADWKLALSGGSLGAVILAAWMFTPPAVGTPVAVVLGVALLVTVLVQRVIAFRHGRDMKIYEDRQKLKQHERQRHETDFENLERRIADLDAELRSASAEAGLPGHVSPSRTQMLLHEAQAAARRFERRQKLSAQLETYAALLAAAVSDEARSKVDRDIAESRVSGLERRFPAKPQQDVELDAAMARQRLMDVHTEAAALTADRRAADSFVAAFLEQATRLQAKADTAEAAAANLTARLESVLAPAAALRALETRRDAVDAELVLAHEGCAQKEEAIAELLSPWGCADEQAFHLRSMDAELYRAAGREGEELRARIERTVGIPVEEVRSQLNALGGVRGLERRMEKLQRQYRRQVRSVRRATEARDAVRHKLEQWGNAERVTLLQARAETLDLVASRKVAQFAVERLALGLLTRRMRKWDQEARPRVMPLASETFGRLTGGAFVHVDVEADDPEELVVQDSRWRASSPEHLPQSSREALFLAFRLAALEEAGHREWPLPLLVDELFANMDGEVMRQCLRVLKRLADRHQVIIVTQDVRVKRALQEERAHVLEVHPASLPPSTVRPAVHG